MRNSILLLFAALFAASVRAQSIDIIPRPQALTEGKGTFRFSAKTAIVADPELRRSAELFAADIQPVVGYRISIAEKGTVSLSVDNMLEAEEYSLAVTPKNIRILGGSPRAVFYALQTLRQLLAPDGTVPAVIVRDKPCFAHRGGMLDSGRHYFSVEEVKRFIDMLAMHKLNVFHWHLSEDQGWRIEIRRYPRLTEVGSIRKQTVIGRYDKSDESRNRYDGTPYGGFYSQADIREIVAYAAERYIEVIPEIDMPGHMLGALASYPQLGCRGEGYEVWTHWGISKDVLCAGKEATFEFVENVLAEVLELFPSKLIHVGGDECPKERWKECPACQKRIREEGLKNENELQSYFMHRVEKWLHQHGRELIGWDEIMQN